MDIKEIIGKVEEKMGDEAFKAELQKDPVKAVENLIGVDLPEEQLKAVTEFIKGKMSLDNIADIAGSGKLDGLKGMLGGLFGKKE